MRTFAVEEANPGLGRLMQLALAGEHIQITKGNAVVELCLAQANRWKEGQTKDGYMEVSLSSYRYFYELITSLITDTDKSYSSLIFRGQRREDWNLESTLDRELMKLKKLRNPHIRKEHLDRFKFAMRGRRGPNPVRDKDMSENDWWSLGQHHGLATPLLDWTTSPFAAMYFAYFEDFERRKGHETRSDTDRRCVFALSRINVQMKNQEIKRADRKPLTAKTLEVFRPLTDENPRLVSQSGLFTRSPDGMSVEGWVKKHFAGTNLMPILFKITFPELDREVALRTLNLMNINHLTLFPDALGSSKFSNLGLLIRHY